MVARTGLHAAIHVGVNVPRHNVLLHAKLMEGIQRGLKSSVSRDLLTTPYALEMYLKPLGYLEANAMKVSDVPMVTRYKSFPSTGLGGWISRGTAAVMVPRQGSLIL